VIACSTTSSKPSFLFSSKTLSRCGWDPTKAASLGSGLGTMRQPTILSLIPSCKRCQGNTCCVSLLNYLRPACVSLPNPAAEPQTCFVDVQLQFPIQVYNWLKFVSTNPASKFYNKFDFTRLAVTGHSRGGKISAFVYGKGEAPDPVQVGRPPPLLASRTPKTYFPRPL
jgi:hypothetical protein